MSDDVYHGTDVVKINRDWKQRIIERQLYNHPNETNYPSITAYDMDTKHYD